MKFLKQDKKAKTKKEVKETKTKSAKKAKIAKPKKKDIAIAILIMIAISVVLTWILPYGYFQNGAFYEYGMNRIGLTDLTTLGYYSAYFAIDRVVFLLVVGGFYGLLSKVEAYKKITSTIAKKLKGKEIISLVVTSVIIAALTSVSTISYGVILFVPFLISIFTKMNLDKISAFTATFGSILIGILGATFGTEGLIGFNSYYAANLGSDVLGSTLVIRSVILLVSLVLFNFFIVLYAKKVLKNKNAEEKVERFVVEESTDKTIKTLPLIIVLSITAILVLLGIINWPGLGVSIFDNFHTWLTELTIRTIKWPGLGISIFDNFRAWLTALTSGEEITIFAYILGNSALAFGTWDLFTICTVLLVISVIIALISKISFNDYFGSIGEGFKQMAKPVIVLVGVYAVFIALYMTPIILTITSKLLPEQTKPSINLDYKGSNSAYFNIDTDDDLKADYNLINQDTNKDGKCDLNCDTNKDGWPDKKLDFDADGKVTTTDKELAEDIVGISTINLDSDGDGIADVNVATEFSFFKTLLASLITNIFHVDLGYTGYIVGDYLVSSFGAIALNFIFLAYVLVYGFLQLFVPTSAILMLGLAYSNIEYKSWFKYAWIFILSILAILAVLFLLLMFI